MQEDLPLVHQAVVGGVEVVAEQAQVQEMNLADCSEVEVEELERVELVVYRRCRHQGVWRSIGLSELGVPERQDFVRLTFGKTKWTD